MDSKEMNQNRIEEIRNENKKSKVKFLLILVVSAIGGMIIGGIGSGAYILLNGEEALQKLRVVYEFAERLLPYFSIAVTGILAIVCYILYKSSKKKYENWDREDEQVINRINEKLSYALWFAGCITIFNYLFYAAVIYFWGQGQGGKSLLVGVAILILALTLHIILQRKIIDLLKIMNPEKKGSIYDLKFQKKWVESCDEAERMLIYQSSYKTYCVLNKVCILLWVIYVVVAMYFPIGFLPVFTVVLIWFILQTVYCMESIRLSK